MLLFGALLAPVKAQNTAFYFDGVDDYVKYDPVLPMIFSDLENGPVTIEVIFSLSTLKDDQILISQVDQITGDIFSLGVNDLGQVYNRWGDNYSFVEIDSEIEIGVCYHLSVVYSPEALAIYINGDQISFTSALMPNHLFHNDQPFFIGNCPTILGSALHGVIDEVRIFGDEITQLEIQNNLFQTFNGQHEEVFASFSFNNLAGKITQCTKGVDHVEGILGAGDIDLAPQWTEGTCIRDPESVSEAFCQPSPPCTFTPTQLLCNGSFDDYCPALRVAHPIWGGSFPGYIMPYDAFINTNVNPIVLSSDVYGWETSFAPRLWPGDLDVINVISSSDFYVPFGIGSHNGDYDVILRRNLQHWTKQPPLTSWNGLVGESGMVGLSATNTASKLTGDGVETTMQNSYKLLPDREYEFSGWFYMSEVQFQPNLLGEIQISFGDVGKEYIAGSAQIQYWDKVQSNNGWQFVTIRFTTPANLSTTPGYSTFRVRNSTPTNLINYSDVNYIWGDDFSLKEYQPQNFFPQYIFSGDHNDLHHRLVRADQTGNVYAVVTAESISTSGMLSTTAEVGIPPNNSHVLSNQKGSLLVKYDSDGTFIWSRYYDGLQIVDLDFKTNGDVVAVGHTIASVGSTTSNFQSVTATCAGTSKLSDDSWQLFVAIIDKLTGNTNNQSYGSIATGHIHPELATGVVVSGNIAYITCRIYDLECSPSIVPRSLDWINSSFSSSTILAYDLITGLPTTQPNGLPSPFGEPISIKKDGSGGFYVLTETQVHHGTGTYPNLSFTSFNLASPNPTYMEPKNGTNEVYVLYRDDSKLELYNRTTGLINTNTTSSDKKPIALASSANGDYIMYNEFSSGFFVDPSGGMLATVNKVMSIEKLDPLNFGMAIWDKESSGSFASPITNYSSYAHSLTAELVCLPNQPNKLAFSGGFEYLPPSISGIRGPWLMSFDGKVLTDGTWYRNGHSFVGTLNDMGSTAQFKMGGTKEASSSISQSAKQNEFSIFPNPVKDGPITINSSSGLLLVVFYNLQGQVKHASEQPQLISDGSYTVPVEGLAKGLYLVELKTLSKTLLCQAAGAIK